MRQAILRETKQQENPLEQVLGSLLGGVASGIIAKQTLRTDYVLLSTYDTQFNQEHLRAIGVLKNFFMLETPKVLSKKDERPRAGADHAREGKVVPHC